MPQATSVVEDRAIAAVSRVMGVVGGLCRDCVNAAACTFPRHPSRPVRSCDEFEAEQPAARRAPENLLTVIFSEPGRPAAEPRDLKGLCVQCAQRWSCRYPKPAGGVWHCEELA